MIRDENRLQEEWTHAPEAYLRETGAHIGHVARIEGDRLFVIAHGPLDPQKVYALNIGWNADDGWREVFPIRARLEERRPTAGHDTTEFEFIADAADEETAIQVDRLKQTWADLAASARPDA